jgi:outer membrane protein assembly factor BamB
MAQTAQELLEQLASSGLVPPEVVESLRRQVAKATKPTAPGTIARLLVDHGHLTETQGERLAGGPLPASKKSASHSGVLGLEPIGEAPLKAVKTPVKPQVEIDQAAAALGLAPIQESSKSAPKPAPAKPAAAAKPPLPATAHASGLTAIDGLMPLEELPTPAKPAAKSSPSTITKNKPAPSSSPSTIAKAKSAPAPAAALVEGLAPLTALPGDDVFGAAATADPFASSPVIPLGDAASLADPLVAGTLIAAPLAGKSPSAAQVAAAPRKKSKVVPILALAIVLLFIVGGVGGYVLTRSNGNEEFELAEQDYQAKSYDAAIAKYSAFLEAFPANSKASTARLHRGMARILAASPTKDNFTAILPAAKTSLDEIGGEKELSQLHGDLAPLLMDMAANLAEQAKQGKSAAESLEKLTQAKDALALATDGRFVPGSLRQWQRMADVEESLALLERDSGRGKALETSLVAIKKQAAAGNLDAALAERAKLLLAYPEVASEPSLQELGQNISKSAAAAVKTSADSSKGESLEAKSAVLASVSLASAKTPAAAETSEQTFFALAAGSVWALDGGTGKLLWSRPCGRSSGNAVTPISAEGGSDVVFVDQYRNELVCVNPRSGALRWRHAFKGPLAGEPLVMDGQIIVATTDGRILAMNARSGNGSSAAQLPQGSRLAPAGASGKIFAVAEHSFLYVLSADLKCEAAVYLGHEPASVQSLPVIIGQHLIVVENRPSAALVHVVLLSTKGLATGPVQQVEIPGVATTPLVKLGERLLVLSDQQTTAFDCQPDGDEPLKKLGETEAGNSLGLARFGTVLADKLWVADDGLRRFDFLPADGTLKEAWAGFTGESLDAPPQAIGDTVFCVRRVAGRAGVVASALKGASGMTLWESQLAQPLASATDVKLDWASLSGHSAQTSPARPTTDSDLIRWGGGRLAISTSGFVALLDAKTGAPLAEPFQLSIRPGTQLTKCSAAPVSSDGDSVVISDGLHSVYLLRLDKATQPRLALVAKAVLKTPAISTVAALETAAFVMDQTGTVQVLSMLEFKAKPAARLNCREVVLGPFAAGKHVVLETDRGEIVCLDATGKVLWKVTLAAGPLAGAPLAVGNDLLLPTKSGSLVRVAAATGKETARADLHQPLAGSPALADGAAFVPTAAGGILKVAIPEKK